MAQRFLRTGHSWRIGQSWRTGQWAGAAAAIFTAAHVSAAAAQQLQPVAVQRSAPDDELADLSRRADDPFADIEAQKDRSPVSVTLRALNKTTARYTDIEAPIEEVAVFGRLEIVPRYCDTRPPEEFPETTAFLQIFDLGIGDEGSADANAADDAGDVTTLVDNPDADELEDAAPASEAADAPSAAGEDAAAAGVAALSDGEMIFSGWMFASTPALNGLEHPVYDVWVIDCKTVVAAN